MNLLLGPQADPRSVMSHDHIEVVCFIRRKCLLDRQTALEDLFDEQLHTMGDTFWP